VELTDGTITLRSPIEDDLPALADAVRSSLAELSPFMPWAAGEYDERDTLAWIRGEHGQEERSFVIVDPSGVIVGSCGLNQFSEINRFANLGYWVRTSCTGKGYATRATRLLARHGLIDLELARIEITMSIENEASRRVAERAGARHEGIMRSRLLLHGRQHDAHLFSLVRADVEDGDDDAG
jgi:RimJ/RimL family protein N-acetyltransferase